MKKTYDEICKLYELLKIKSTNSEPNNILNKGVLGQRLYVKNLFSVVEKPICVWDDSVKILRHNIKGK